MPLAPVFDQDKRRRELFLRAAFAIDDGVRVR
jgi:hypothetical protein